MVAKTDNTKAQISEYPKRTPAKVHMVNVPGPTKAAATNTPGPNFLSIFLVGLW
jgi:hypothetical protein